LFSPSRCIILIRIKIFATLEILDIYKKNADLVGFFLRKSH